MKGKWGRLEGITWFRKQLHPKERKWFPSDKMSPRVLKSQKWVVGWHCFEAGW